MTYFYAIHDDEPNGYENTLLGIIASEEPVDWTAVKQRILEAANGRGVLQKRTTIYLWDECLKALGTNAQEVKAETVTLPLHSLWDDEDNFTGWEWTR